MYAGRQELFDSGVLHSYMYGKLYNPNSKIIARTTVCIMGSNMPDMMLISLGRHKTGCSNRPRTSWLASLDWNGRSDSLVPSLHTDPARTQNVTIEVIIEAAGFNNSLAGYMNCPNGRKSTSGTKAATLWVTKYLQKGRRWQAHYPGEPC